MKRLTSHAPRWTLGLALTALALGWWGLAGAGWAWLATQTAGALWCALDLAVHRDSFKAPVEVNTLSKEDA